MKNDFVLIAHRGASNYEPENTLASFEKAVELGAKVIEFDVRKTLDNELVVIHDSKLDRTTNEKGPVSGKTLPELKKVDAGKGMRIPTVREILSIFKGGVKFVVEIKEEDTEEQLIELARELDVADDIIFVSFKKKILKKIKLLDPNLKTGLITVFGYNCVENASVLGCCAVATSNLFVTSKNIRKAHSNGLLFFCWTVNNKSRCITLKEMGVDGVITDIPDLLGTI